MVYNLISSKQVIAKILSDLDMSEGDLRISDVQEWIGEAVEKIGGLSQLVTKVSGEHGEPILPVIGYQVKLPCDLHTLNSVAFSMHPKGHWLPVRLSTNSFKRWSEKGSKCVTGASCGSCCDTRFYKDEELARLLMDMDKTIVSPQDAIDKLNDNINLRQTLTWLISKNDTYGPGSEIPHRYDIQYSIKPGYINLNVPNGFVKLAYTAVPRDEDGYVMIPDLASVQEAIYWYVTMKLMYPKYYRGDIPQHVYHDAKQSWNNNRKNAYAEIIMPNMDGLQTVANTWNKIYPEMRDNRSFFEHTGQRQLIYDNDRRYWNGYFGY